MTVGLRVAASPLQPFLTIDDLSVILIIELVSHKITELNIELITYVFGDEYPILVP